MVLYYLEKSTTGDRKPPGGPPALGSVLSKFSRKSRNSGDPSQPHPLAAERRQTAQHAPTSLGDAVGVRSRSPFDPGNAPLGPGENVGSEDLRI